MSFFSHTLVSNTNFWNILFWFIFTTIVPGSLYYKFITFWWYSGWVKNTIINFILDPWRYLVQDEEAEKKWNFLLKLSLSNASKTKLLDGYNVFATSSVLPSPKDLKGTVFVIFWCWSFLYSYSWWGKRIHKSLFME